jgi:hypothetical protein
MTDAVARLIAAEEIRQLVQVYPWAIDVGDLDTVAAGQDGMKVRVFGPDREQVGEAVVRTADEVRQLYSDLVVFDEDGWPHTKHLITNIVINVAEDAQSATGGSYFTVLQGCAGFPLQVVIAGRYVDRYERRDGQWRIAERDEHCDLVGDLSKHLTVSLDEASGHR